MSDALEQTFVQASETLNDLSFASVRRWKRDHGGRVIAYFPVYAPVEIIHAAGMLPVCLAGAGDRLDLQHADARFGSFICSIVKSTLEMGLTGHLDPFDGFLFSTICDSARNLCWVMKRNFPDRCIDFLHLPQNSTSPATVDFLSAEYRRLGDELGKLRGEPLRDDDLRSAIRLYNHNRALVRSLYRLRAEQPHLLRASELYCLVRAGHFMPVEEHSALLDHTLPALRARDLKRRDSLRVVVEGAFCEQPPLEVLKLIEAAGCYIVDDDLALAHTWFAEDVPHDLDPYRELADAYVHGSVYSSVRHDYARPRSDQLAAKIERARADAVILLIAKFCEPAYFDYVLYRKKLDELGVPHLLIEFEEKLFTFERLRTEVETFVESLVFD